MSLIDITVIEGMLKLDTSQPETPTLTNMSIPTFLRPRLDGSMIHVPVGKKGILVLIGGQRTADPNTPWGVPVEHASWGNIMASSAFYFASLHTVVYEIRLQMLSICLTTNIP